MLQTITLGEFFLRMFERFKLLILHRGRELGTPVYVLNDTTRCLPGNNNRGQLKATDLKTEQLIKAPQ